MKNTKKSPALPQPKLDEEDIRDYARHLYEQTGCIEGRHVQVPDCGHDSA